MVRLQGPASHIYIPDPYPSSSPRIAKQTNGKMLCPGKKYAKRKDTKGRVVTLQQSLSHLLAIMKGFVSSVLITMAFLKMTAAAPAVLELSSGNYFVALTLLTTQTSTSARNNSSARSPLRLKMSRSAQLKLFVRFHSSVLLRLV
ncbi:hypothetical protein K503DRAFT_71680 [Rhizopogon vinicolor AM-OR11-026]|uniref:Uncharacterized protein n=1 Tax=Rhizopogon vinicolor AM-OR11-026 TaxID=1314800 RepID=A0A1B7N452_9AGAM|nr:hypothetical protein K503DRAFT_71680 [Rhizopogon vinicolor AM-OR11-026]